MDEVYLPMLARVDSDARVWQPPETIKATGWGVRQIMNNLIANPDFETGDLSGWESISGNWQVISNASIITSPHSGKYWLLLNGGTNARIRSNTMTVTPGTTLRISLWRAEATTGRSSEVLMLLPDGTLQQVMPLPKVSPEQTLKWLRYETTWTVPEGVTQTALVIHSVEDSYTRIDDVEVTEEI